MAFGSFDSTGSPAPLAEINMIPLIDVMLVLLVIFMVTVPMMTHAVKVELPRAASEPDKAPQPPITLSVQSSGQLFWDGAVVGRDALEARLATAAQAASPPELRIRADRTVEYRHVADVMSAAARAGITRIGFVTDPAQASR